MFGESNIGDVGHQGHNKAAAMADSDEVCGCNGVTKGTICKAIKDKGLFTLDEVRKHTKASASCGSCTGLVEQLLMATAGGDYSATPKKKAMCGCTDHGHQACATPSGAAPADHRRRLQGAGLAHAQRLRQLPPGHQLLPAEHLAQGGAGRPAKPLHQRAQPRQHPEGRHLQRDPAHVGRRDHGGRAAPHCRRGGQVQDPHRQGHRRPAHRPAGREEGRPARVWKDIGMPSGHAYAKALRTVKTCVGSEWCRFGTQDSTQMGKDLERALWRMYAPHKVKLAVSGCPRNCAEAGIKDVGVIGVDSGWEIYVAGNGGIKTEVAQFLVKLKTAEEVLEYSGAFLQLYREEGWYLERTVHYVAASAGPREAAHPRRRRRPQGAVGAAAVRAGRRARPVVRVRQGAGGPAAVRAAEGG
jgi:nitrite reductase (NADH) large subunit